MLGPMPTTVQKLVSLVLDLQGRLAEAERRVAAADLRVAQLERENADLRARLSKDCHS